MQPVESGRSSAEPHTQALAEALSHAMDSGLDRTLAHLEALSHIPVRQIGLWTREMGPQKEILVEELGEVGLRETQGFFGIGAPLLRRGDLCSSGENLVRESGVGT